MSSTDLRPVSESRRGCGEQAALRVAGRWLAPIGVSLVLVACDSRPREPLPDWSAGYEDAGTHDGFGDAATPPTPGETPVNFALVVPQSVTWPVRLGLASDITLPCAVTASDGQAGFEVGREIDCLMDVNELDLYVLGVRYDIHVPEGMCDMLLHIPYVHANYALGVGPDRVAYTVETDGTYSDELNSMNGKPYCPYDHSRIDPRAPNCCFGTYTLQITSRESGNITSEQRTWGGRRGDCFYGGGYVQEGASFDPQGLPMSYFVHTEADVHVEHVVFEGISDKYSSNLALANYFDPDDHGGSAPAGLTAPGARPYYQAECLDDAGEIIARIRLSVREWNEEAEFFGGGDPDTTGIEPGWQSGLIDIDDLSDWATQTPGDIDYPAIPVVQSM